MDGRADVARRGGAGGAARRADRAGVRASRSRGALFGPVLGGIASVAGTGWTFGGVAAGSLGVAAWAALTPAARPGDAAAALGARARAPRDRRVLLAGLARRAARAALRDARRARRRCGSPSSGSARSRSARSGSTAGVLETGEQRRRRPPRPTAAGRSCPSALGLIARRSSRRAPALARANAYVLGARDRLRRGSPSAPSTRPAMTLLTTRGRGSAGSTTATRSR